MDKYIIRRAAGDTLEIEGEPCLQQEYPDLQLFVGYYPCYKKGKEECYCPSILHGCHMFRVCEINTGANLYPELHLTPKDAIEAANLLIKRFDVEEVKRRIRYWLAKINNQVAAEV